MKKNVIKTAVAAVCVVAAGFGSMKAYNNVNQPEADLLFAENVEALSQIENTIPPDCRFTPYEICIKCGGGVCAVSRQY